MVIPLPAAVTMSVEEPVSAVAAAASVNVLLPLPGALILVGAKVPVTPVGSPLTDKASAELNPFAVLVVKVTGFELPAGTLTLPALEVRMKLEGGRIVRPKATVWLASPPTAPSVTV